jgi:DNA-binding transcriptional LysR family regulator
MNGMKQFLATVPFDLYELTLFHLVVKNRSFTKTAELAGLTQSAITRQIQGIEQRLGVRLLERTTRNVRVTPAGEFLYREAGRVLGSVESSLQHLQEEFANARKIVRVSVSRSIALSYLPGFFHANLRRDSKIEYRVSHLPSEQILSEIESNEQDVGVLCPPRRLPKTIRVTHRFQDTFVIIASQTASLDLPPDKKRIDEWLQAQNWLLIEESSNTGKQLRSWIKRQGLRISPVMQLDNFDLIINLVSLGMGISLVPIRALALYNRKKNIVRIPYKKRFSRQLIVVVRKHRHMQPHLENFIENILF